MTENPMPAPEPDDPLLTVPEIARELRYSEVSVRRWIREGQLSAIQPAGREYRVRRSALDEMLTTIKRRSNPNTEPLLTTANAQPAGQPGHETLQRIADACDRLARNGFPACADAIADYAHERRGRVVERAEESERVARLAADDVHRRHTSASIGLTQSSESPVVNSPPRPLRSSRLR